jgi:hypothetical protein
MTTQDIMKLADEYAHRHHTDMSELTSTNAYNRDKARAELAKAIESLQSERDALAAELEKVKLGKPEKFWLWKNFVEGKPEYWAFDNAFPIGVTHDDPQTIGEPCGYALFKSSRKGRSDISDEEVLRKSSARSVEAITQPVPAHDIDVSFFAGVCVCLQAITAADDSVLWREIVLACGKKDLLFYATEIEPCEWELAGFSKYA